MPTKTKGARARQEPAQTSHESVSVDHFPTSEEFNKNLAVYAAKVMDAEEISLRLNRFLSESPSATQFTVRDLGGLPVSSKLSHCIRPAWGIVKGGGHSVLGV